MKNFVLILTLTVCNAAHADELTAGLLYKLCDAKNKVEETACRFYILGVIQGAALVDGSTMVDDGRLVAKNKTLFCEPNGAPQSLLVGVFKKWMQVMLETRPETAKSPAHSVVMAAMHAQFPCGK